MGCMSEWGELWIVNCELWILNCELWIVNCELWIVNRIWPFYQESQVAEHWKSRKFSLNHPSLVPICVSNLWVNHQSKPHQHFNPHINYFVKKRSHHNDRIACSITCLIKMIANQISVMFEYKNTCINNGIRNINSHGRTCDSNNNRRFEPGQQQQQQKHKYNPTTNPMSLQNTWYKTQNTKHNISTSQPWSSEYLE